MVYLQRCLVVTWPVPREAAAVSAPVLCTPYNHAPVFSVTLFEATGLSLSLSLTGDWLFPGVLLRAVCADLATTAGTCIT